MKALITGASEGMGKAISESLAKEGYDLILCARREETLSTFRDGLLQSHPHLKIRIVAIDFSKPEDVKALEKLALAEFPDLDVLVNNVGSFQPGSLLTGQEDALETMLQVNLMAAYRLARIFAKGMAARKQGHIFAIGSIGGKEAVKGAGSYSVTKFALQGLMINLREELKEWGVKVTSILPGSTLTSSWKGTTIPADQFILPEDIAEAVLSCLRMSKGANVEEILVRPLNFG